MEVCKCAFKLEGFAYILGGKELEARTIKSLN